MIAVEEIKEQYRQEYDEFVWKNTNSFLQSYEWGEWQASLNRPVFRYLVKDYETLLSVQLIKHQLPFGKYYLYCPYGPVISKQLTVNSRQLTDGVSALLGQIKKDFPDCLFVKLEPQSVLPVLDATGYKLQASTRIQPASTLLLDLTKNADKLLAEMHTKNRYNIRVAKKHGVHIKHGFIDGNGEEKKVVELIHQTTLRQNYNGHPLSYYEKFISFFSSLPESSTLKAVWYAAYLGEEMLAGAIFIDFAKTRDFLFGGSSDSHREAMASFLMQWQSIQDAKEKGFVNFDFGGTETSSGELPGFVKFKLRFGGNQENFPKATDVVLKKSAYCIYSALRKIHNFVKTI